MNGPHTGNPALARNISGNADQDANKIEPHHIARARDSISKEDANAAAMNAHAATGFSAILRQFFEDSRERSPFHVS
jgi:hypothetical protein